MSQECRDRALPILARWRVQSGRDTARTGRAGTPEGDQ
jgi:hypothetical protein